MTQLMEVFREMINAEKRQSELVRREAEALADLDLLMRAINEYRAAVNEAGHHESVAPCAVCTPIGRTRAEQDAASRAMNAQANRLDAVLAMIKSRRP